MFLKPWRLEVTRQLLLPRADQGEQVGGAAQRTGYTDKTHLRGLKTFDFSCFPRRWTLLV